MSNELIKASSVGVPTTGNAASLPVLVEREVVRRLSPGIHPELIKLAVEDAMEISPGGEGWRNADRHDAYAVRA